VTLPRISRPARVGGSVKQMRQQQAVRQTHLSAFFTKSSSPRTGFRKSNAESSLLISSGVVSVP
jgi:hypothetical protein